MNAADLKKMFEKLSGEIHEIKAICSATQSELSKLTEDITALKKENDQNKADI